MRNLDLVAHIAAQLLAGRADAEAHHIRKAVETARAIVDEADREEIEAPVATAPAPEPATDATPVPPVSPATEPGDQAQ